MPKKSTTKKNTKTPKSNAQRRQDTRRLLTLEELKEAKLGVMNAAFDLQEVVAGCYESLKDEDEKELLEHIRALDTLAVRLEDQFNEVTES